jgi:hypothetical protein
MRPPVRCYPFEVRVCLENFIGASAEEHRLFPQEGIDGGNSGYICEGMDKLSVHQSGTKCALDGGQLCSPHLQVVGPSL